MALETGIYISDLVPTNPLGSDPLAFADDHTRLIKATLKNTFPNVTGAVTKTHTALNNIPDNTNQAIASLQSSINQASGAAVALTAIYPVGSVYINTSNASNPSVLFGFGTWVQFGAGRVMMGVGGGFAAGATGGSADAIVVSHTHTAASTVSDPGHQHSFLQNPVLNGQQNGGRDTNGVGPVNTGSAFTGITVATTVNSAGVTGVNANLQPFIVVYMWNRTA